MLQTQLHAVYLYTHQLKFAIMLDFDQHTPHWLSHRVNKMPPCTFPYCKQWKSGQVLGTRLPYSTRKCFIQDANIDING